MIVCIGKIILLALKLIIDKCSVVQNKLKPAQ